MNLSRVRPRHWKSEFLSVLTWYFVNNSSDHTNESIADLSRFVQCPCCCSTHWRVVWNNPTQKAILDWKEFMYGGRQFIGKILQCEACGYRHVQAPTIGDGFYAHADVSCYNSLARARIRYFSELKVALCQRGFILQDGARMLDLGAGEGDWLAAWPEVKSRYATEMHPTLIRSMNERGINTVPSLDRLANMEFHLISAFDFLEHVEDPNRLLQHIHRRMVDGGAVVIGVPNMGKWAARLLGTRYYLYCPMHYSYFTEKALRALLGRHFSQVDIFLSPPMHTTLSGVAKWILPKLQNAVLDKIWLPMGYRASLIAIARKPL